MTHSKPDDAAVTNRTELVRESLLAREHPQDPDRLRGIERVEIEVVAPLGYRARVAAEGDHVMSVDEPIARGGGGSGNSPLAHFLTGVGSCLLNQFIRIALADGLPVEFQEARVRGEFRRSVGGGFERIRTEIRATGTLPMADCAALVERAEGLCYVQNTLNRAVQMITTFVLNGNELSRSESGPRTQGPW